MIAIIDYDSGNIKAIANIYSRLGISFFIADKAIDLKRATKIILPGVGTFDYAVNHLERSGMKEMLETLVLNHNVPILGICVGMQLLGRSSEEGQLSGLNWIDGEVKKFDSVTTTKRYLPHMGWNDIQPVKAHSLFNNIPTGSRYYFLHSYYFSHDKDESVLATADYAGEFACAVSKNNIFGVQFHPEKSHQSGIQLLENFGNLKLC